MAFDTLNDRLRVVATSSLALCRRTWGGNGLKKEEAIHDKIGWRPTFYMKPNHFLIVAFEVSDNIYPEVLKGAAHDIEHHDFPIAVYQACSLEVFQRDPRLARVHMLRDHGFGIITVDDTGQASVQMNAAPLAQHIPQVRLEDGLRGLTPALRIRFNSAYMTYQTNPGQGLQEAGQIIEALIGCIAKQAEAASVVPAGTALKSTATIIDDLYPTGTFHNYRAELGGARSFVREYRNIASHAPANPKQAANKFRKCRGGFYEALKLGAQLRDVIQKVGYQVRLV